MKDTLNGTELKEMFTAATNWLEKLVPDINALNVYPVPDGDCGTNMLFTMRASLAEATQHSNGSVSSVAQAMARGALMGARGNSGVILSQIWRGLAQGLKSQSTLDGKLFATALAEASRTAYKALSHPVEGTILTVIKDSASAARQTADNNSSLVNVLEDTVSAARASVVKTPELLSVLKEAGVVDAGGHGLFTLLEGALLYIKGEAGGDKPQLIAGDTKPAINPVPVAEEEAYGFCTQFLLHDDLLDTEDLRIKLQDMGKSLIVVGDSSTVRVHIHTLDPDGVTGLAASYGRLTDIDIRNMDEQHKDFLLMHRDKTEHLESAIVTVVNGEGLANVFFDLGASAIVPGGQSMNPSTMDILQAVEAVPSNNVIILPNNKNIVLTAGQVQKLTRKNIRVIPTETIPQGVTAMIAFSPEAAFSANTAQMTEAFDKVKTIEITIATRSARLDGLDIKEGKAIGLLDGRLIAAGDTAEDLVINILTQLDLTGASIFTIYYGALTSETDAAALTGRLREAYPRLEVETINGGQPHYNYIVSVE
jgi:uncharacterized protein